MRSNLIRNISGDRKLNLFQYIYWMFIAYLNIKFDRFKIYKRLQVINYKPKKTYSSLKKKKPSPSRYLCDLFWKELPYRFIFPYGFRAVEVGCGTGVYGNFLKKNKNFKTYTGIDIKNNWKFNDKKLNFIQDSFKNIDNYFYKINFLFTQSALEHFDEDLDFHFKISKQIKKNYKKKKFFQLHFVPSENCLFTYLAHGYRHFTINSISKICEFYDKNETEFIVFKLGSINSLKLHLRYITLPKFYSKFTSRYEVADYKVKLDDAILKDSNDSENDDSSFYAIMILSNYKKSEVKRILDHYR